MANALEMRYQCAQTRSDKARPNHRFIDRCEMRFLTMRAVAGHAAVLADLDPARDDYNLANDPSQFTAGLDPSAAIRADRQVVVPRLIDLLRENGGRA